MDVPADGLTAAQAVRKAATQPVFISWLALAFMTTASVASLRSSPTMAVYGLACVFLYIVPAIVFLLPQALVAAELASGWEGGVYRWVSEGLSGPWGMLAVWCQFAMTIFYYPTLLGFVASTLAYVFNPELATNGVYTGIVIVVVFWLGVLMSARGGVGGIAKLASSGLLIGTLIPGALLVVLGIVYLLQGNGSAAPMDASHLLPKWAGIASLVLIVNNFLSYSGMEMNAVHVSSLRNPGREFPKAMFFAVGLVLLIFILPALAISWVVPAQQLSLTAGVMQAFSAFFGYFNLEFLVPIVAIALVCASAGGMLTWLAGPSKGLVMIARKEGYMPPFFQRQNENEIPVNILLVQGGITTVIALLYALIPSVSSAYWILSVMTTQVYLVVYLLMFVAARQLRRNQPEVERGYRAPWLTFLCVVGFVASAAAIVIGFVPPSQFGDSNAAVYALIILAGTVLIGLLPAWLFLKLRKPSWKTTEEAAIPEPAPAAAEPAPLPEEPVVPAAPEPATAAGEPVSRGGGHRRLYWILGAVVAILVVVGLVTYNAGKNNQEAKQKAQELTQKYEQAGLHVPEDIETITRSLGTDGGAVCDNPANALGKAILNDQLTNGADFVGRRPVRIDRRIVLGEALILETYCPDKLQAYQDKIDDLKYANTIKP
jgi:glutamate:GABA antiporter